MSLQEIYDKKISILLCILHEWRKFQNSIQSNIQKKKKKPDLISYIHDLNLFWSIRGLIERYPLETSLHPTCKYVLSLSLSVQEGEDSFILINSSSLDCSFLPTPFSLPPQLRTTAGPSRTSWKVSNADPFSLPRSNCPIQGMTSTIGWAPA